MIIDANITGVSYTPLLCSELKAYDMVALENGVKAQITVKNYLGGLYYLTSDEARINGNTISIIESKHTKSQSIPSLGDIKDGLIKMLLWTNLKDVRVDGRKYDIKPVLKLTSGSTTPCYSDKQRSLIVKLKQEASVNKFQLELPQGCEL
ncbi:hypothetical protein RsTz2092_13290 [Deferribacterales bacterium RsTz2092]|nr:hypothetical protein AGMMS49941_12360 [Deferribacterales bacterium]